MYTLTAGLTARPPPPPSTTAFFPPPPLPTTATLLEHARDAEQCDREYPTVAAFSCREGCAELWRSVPTHHHRSPPHSPPPPPPARSSLSSAACTAARRATPTRSAVSATPSARSSTPLATRRIRRTGRAATRRCAKRVRDTHGRTKSNGPIHLHPAGKRARVRPLPPWLPPPWPPPPLLLPAARHRH